MEDFKYYTMFGVRADTDTKTMTPKFARDFVLRWTTNEREACKLAQAMVDNEMCPTTSMEACDAVGITHEASAIEAVAMRVRFNPSITVHLFETDWLCENEFIDIMINAANVSDFGKEKLVESRINL